MSELSSPAGLIISRRAVWPAAQEKGQPSPEALPGGSIVTITLDRPEAKNTLSPSMISGLIQALATAGDDPGCRAIILTNSGSTFCAGADLTAARPGVQIGDNATSATDSSEPNPTLTALFEAMHKCPVPIIGRIDGHAVGGGVGLMAACDLSYVRNDIKIGFTEVRLGLAPAVISVVCLPKMRRADAMERFLTGERFSPAEAMEMGLINASVDPDQLDSHVNAIALKIARGGPSGVSAAKELVYRVPEMQRSDALSWTAELSQRLFDGAEGQAGIAAFRHRENSPWDGSAPLA